MKNICAITGAGSGIGFSIAREFGKEMAVAICGRTKEKIDQAVADLKAGGVDAFGMVCDVSSKESTEAFAATVAENGKIRVVVNAAGVSPGQGVDAKVIYGINMIGAINITEAFFPYLEEGGVLIHIASMSAHMFPINDGIRALCEAHDSPDLLERALETFPNPGHAYPVSKRFVIEYVKISCEQFANKGMRILSISPGIVDTPLLGASKESENVKEIIRKTPLGRMSEPEEYGYLARFLASEQASSITGIDILVDAGFMSVFGK